MIIGIIQLNVKDISIPVSYLVYSLNASSSSSSSRSSFSITASARFFCLAEINVMTIDVKRMNH